MTPRIDLTGLDGNNPLGFFAALGTLVVCERMRPEAEPRLSWATTVVPHAVLYGMERIQDATDAVLRDRDEWRASPALQFAVDGSPSDDVKFAPPDLRAYLRRANDVDDGGRSRALAGALVAEGSLGRNGRAKPTDFHFTAGNQQFLAMARGLRDGISSEDVVEALVGPWKYASKLPSSKWDVTDDRVHALMGRAPGEDKKPTVPGAEWLALMGLAVLPVAMGHGRTLTTACDGPRPRGRFTWALWEAPIGSASARTLLGLSLGDEREWGMFIRRGLFRVLQSAITGTPDRYGSFRPSRVLWDRPPEDAERLVS